MPGRGKTDGGTSQAQQDAVVASHTRLMTELQNHDVNRRVSAFDLQMIHDAPLTVASIALSGLPVEHVEKIGAGLGNGGGWAWLKNINSSADQPGSGDQLVPQAVRLMQRNMVAEQPAPATTAGATTPLQSALAASGTGYTPVTPSADEQAVQQAAGAPATPPDIVVGSAKALYNVDGKSVRVVTDDPNSQDAKHLLTQLQSQGVEVSGFQAPGVTGALAQAGTEFTSLASKPFDILGSVGNYIRYNAPGTNVPGIGQLETGLGTAVNATAKTVQYGIGGATDILGGGLQSAAHDVIAPFTGHKVLNPVDYMFPGLTHTGAVGSGYGTAVVDSLGIPPSNPEHDQLEGLFNFAGQWAVGGRLFRDIAGVKAAGEELPMPEAATAEEIASHSSVLRERYGTVGSKLYQFVQDVKYRGGLDRWLQSSYGGKRLVNRIVKVSERTPADEIAGKLQRTYDLSTMPPDLADALAGAHGDPNIIRSTIGEYWRASTDAGNLRIASYKPEWYQRLQSVEDTLANGENLAADDIANLAAERAQLRVKLATPTFEPVEILPKTSFVRRITSGAPANTFEAFFEHLYNPRAYTGPGASVFRHLDVMTGLFSQIGDNSLLNPFKGDAPKLVMERNAEALRSQLRFWGVDNAGINRLLSEHAGMKATGDFYELVKHTYAALHDKAVASGAPADVLSRLERVWDSQVNGVHYGGFTQTLDGADGSITAVTPALHHTDPVNGQDIPQPLYPEQFAGRVQLPSTDMVYEATRLRRILENRVTGGYNWIAKWSQRAPRETRFADLTLPQALGKVAMIPYDVLHSTLVASTAILKPLLLVTELPRLIMRSESDQTLANLFDPTQSSIYLNKARSEFRGEAPPTINTIRDPFSPAGVNPRDLGVFVDQSVGRAEPTLRSWTEPFKTGTRELNDGVMNSRIEQIKIAANSQTVRELVNRGPQGFADWVQTTDPSAEYILGQMKPILDKGRLVDFERDATGHKIGGRTQPWSVPEWADRTYASLHELAGGDQSLMDAFASGSWHRGVDFASASKRRLERAGVSAPDLQRRFDGLVAEKDIVTEQLRSVGDDVSRKAALQKRRLQIVDQANQLAADYGVTPNVIKLADGVGLRSALNEDIANGTHTLPPQVLVDHSLREVVGHDASAGDLASRVEQILYKPLKAHTAADMKLARGQTFYNIWSADYRRWKSWGYSEADAKGLADVNAARYTSDLHYTLTARSSTQLAVRNIYWFAPVVQAFFKRWLVDLPRKYYWPLGVGFLANRGDLAADAFRAFGLVTTNPTSGKPETLIPGGKALMEKLTGGVMPNTLQGITANPLGWNLALSGDFGLSMSPIPSAALATAAKHFPALKALDQMMLPYGNAVTFGPASASYFYETMTGKRPPWEMFSGDYQQATWDSRRIDAIRMASEHLAQQGIYPPTPESFMAQKQYLDPATGFLNAAGQQAFAKAMDDYNKQAVGESSTITRATSFLGLLGSTIFPTTLHASDSGAIIWQNYYDQNIANAPPEEHSALIAKFLQQHPDLYPYTIAKTYLGPDAPPNLPTGSLNEYSWQLYQGWRKVYTPDDYMALMTANESHRLFASRMQQQMDAIGTDAPTILVSGFAKQMAVIQHWEAKQTYDAVNVTGNALLQKEFANLAAQGNTPTTVGTTMLTDALRTLQDLAQRQATDGVRSSEMMTAIRNVETALASESFSGPVGKVQQGLDWYYSNVLDPYFKATGPLYDRATALRSAGLDASPAYDKIRALQNNWDQRSLVGPDGLTYPSPSAVFWGNLNPTEQQVRVMKWAAEPLGWQSDFQLEKVLGSAPTPAFQDGLGQISKLQSMVATTIAKNALSPSSNLYAALQTYQQQQMVSIAQNSGDAQLQKMVQLNFEPPAQRLVALGVVKDPTFQQFATEASTFATQLAAQQLSYKSDSGLALAVKLYMFPQIDKAIQQDPNGAFAQTMNLLGFSTATGSLTQTDGPLLYDRIFFDNWGDTNWGSLGYQPTG